MTSDYVSWVLGLQGWERARREDAYFAGEEDVLGNSQRETTPEEGTVGSSSVTVGCQTPAEWAELEHAQKGNEAVPESPPHNKIIHWIIHWIIHVWVDNPLSSGLSTPIYYPPAGG